MDGIIIVNKPIGFTSRDVVNKVMKKFNTKKVGHTGTLDPFASGVLILTINKGTKISNFIEALDKSYIGELKLGVNTDTLDLEGQVLETKEVPLPLDKEKIQKAMNKYIGDIKQVPPMYSAIKIDGEELYKKARRGEVVERKLRDVHISSINLLSVVNEKILFQVDCSKGTYIRTLGNDIGNDLGFGGHLTMLTRVRVGKYTIKQAKNYEDLTEEDIIPINDALSYMETRVVDGDYEKKARNGVPLFFGEDELVYVKNKHDEPIAIYKKESDGKHHSLRGLF
jgi:tRNA pseudouridine55 synthase